MTEQASNFDLTVKECFFKLQETRGDKVFHLIHWFKLPAFEDWSDYLKQRGFIGYSKGRDTFEFSNVMQEEDAEFWGKLVTRVEGYKYQGKDIMDLPNWKELIPIRHKLEVIGGFLSFSKVDTPDEDKISSDEGLDLSDSLGSTVKFWTVFNGDEINLTFNFAVPQTSDYVKYNRMATKTQMVRTKQRNVSAIKSPVKLDVYLELFDKLILSVEGYKFNKESSWKLEVPVYHKREAVRELFGASLRMEESGSD